MSRIENIFDVVNQAPKKQFGALVNSASQSNISSNRSYDYMYSSGFIFNQFTSLKNAFDKIEEIRAKPNRSSYENSALSKVNSYPTFSSFETDINTDTTNFKRLKKFVKNASNSLKSIINLGGSLKRDKIKITQDERGVFDFSLASQGLYRPVEYFAYEFEKHIKKTQVNPYKYLDFEDGVVPPDKVNKLISGMFVFDYDGNRYVCERRQTGTTKVFNTFSDICYLKSNPQGLILPYLLSNKDKVFNGEGKIKLKYASSNKKSFLIYEKKNDNVKHVDIFIPVNFLGINDSSKAIAFLPAFLVALFLRDYGVQTRISAMRMGTDNGTHTAISIAVKDYDDDIDNSFNSIFNLFGKTTYGATFFAFFKIFCSNEGIQASPTYDTSDSFGTVRYYNQDYINEMMQRYKNWIEVNKDKPFVNTRVTNPNFQFGIATTSNNISSSPIKNADLLDNVHNIFFKFYYYIDFLSIEMLPMQEFVKNLYTRVNEDTFFKKLYTIPSQKKDIIEMLRTYVLTLLVEKYTLVSSGEYADTIEQQAKKRELFTEKVSALNESLNSL